MALSIDRSRFCRWTGGAADRQRWLCPSTEAASADGQGGVCPSTEMALSMDTTSIWYCILEMHLAGLEWTSC
eukprot:4044997-Pleurochrysis_carterae.AAC.1